MMETDLQRAIADAADIVSQMSDVDRACEVACERLEAALGGPVAILERVGPRWRLRSSSQYAPVDGADNGVADGALTLRELTARAEAVQWAWVPLGPSEQRIMLVPTDWHPTQAALLLEASVRQLGIALEAAALRTSANRRTRTLRESYGFTRRLAGVTGHAQLHQFISDEAVRASRANLGALALVGDDGSLKVAATSGYPRVLVEHVRIRSGEGVIGTVFDSRRPLLVSDISRHPHLHRPRPRYKTPSFMAVPVLAPQRAMGVLCLADRGDGLSFDGDDLRLVRNLAASAALALAADELAQRAELLSTWATVDPVTELFNRRYFRQRLEEELQRARRYALPLSLLLLDVDDFKRVNDTYGHPAGDTVLRSLADVFRRSVRAFDMCCRYGGDEFVLVLPGSDSADAMSTANRVRQAAEAQRITVRPNEPPLRVTVSVGSTTLARGDSADDLVAHADRALYDAKQHGKNQIRVAET